MDYLTARDGVAFQHTVNVEWKKFHAFRKNELAGGRRRCAILSVAGQNLGRPLYVIIFDRFRRRVEDFENSF